MASPRTSQSAPDASCSIRIGECEALLLVEAIKLDLKRRHGLAVAARDNADRDAWALEEVKGAYLQAVLTQLRFYVQQIGAPTADGLAALGDAARMRRSRMPHSKGNRASLRLQHSG